MTRSQLLSEMSATEYAIWLASEEFDPIGQVRGDLQAGIVAAAAINVWAGQDDKRASPIDFVPDFGGLRAEAESRQDGNDFGAWVTWARERNGDRPGTTDAQADG